jgi:hypothetical protein
MTSFSSILDRQASEIEAPKPFPAGSYTCVVKGLPRFDKSTKKGTDFVEFTLQPVQALEDVSEDDLEAFGPIGEKTLRVTFYITEYSVYRLKNFLDALGLDPTGRSLNQLINDSPGQSVIAHVTHSTSKDGQRIFHEVDSTTRYGD